MRHVRPQARRNRRAEQLEKQAKAIMYEIKYTDSASARMDLTRQADALYKQAMNLRRGPGDPNDDIFF